VTFRTDTRATAIAATTMTRSPAASPSASQIGDTSMPARQRSRTLSLASKRRDVRARRSIELGIDILQRLEIPQVGGV
jgi:hypothetical protein